MPTTLNLLQTALKKLREAEDQAGIGTSMMIEPIRKQLERLVERTENIEDNE